jgi:hypothetical protein
MKRHLTREPFFCGELTDIMLYKNVAATGESASVDSSGFRHFNGYRVQPLSSALFRIYITSTNTNKVKRSSSR